MAIVHRDIMISDKGEPYIRFIQPWPAATYHTEAGYGIDRIPHVYPPIRALIDKGYQYKAKVYPVEIVDLSVKNYYIAEVDFEMPEQDITFYCLSWPSDHFSFHDH